MSQIGKARFRGGEQRQRRRKTGNGRGGKSEGRHRRELKGAGGDVRHTRGDAICLDGRTFVECVSVDELDGGREEVVDSRKGRAIVECVFPDGFQPVVELDVDERRAAIERVARNPDESVQDSVPCVFPAGGGIYVQQSVPAAALKPTAERSNKM